MSKSERNFRFFERSNSNTKEQKPEAITTRSNSRLPFFLHQNFLKFLYYSLRIQWQRWNPARPPISHPLDLSAHFHRKKKYIKQTISFRLFFSYIFSVLLSRWQKSCKISSFCSCSSDIRGVVRIPEENVQRSFSFEYFFSATFSYASLHSTFNVVDFHHPLGAHSRKKMWFHVGRKKNIFEVKSWQWTVDVVGRKKNSVKISLRVFRNVFVDDSLNFVTT